MSPCTIFSQRTERISLCGAYTKLGSHARFSLARPLQIYCRRVFLAWSSRPIWNKLCNSHMGKNATNLLRSSDYTDRHQGLILSSKDFSPGKYEHKKLRYFTVYTSWNLSAPRTLLVRLLPPVLMKTFSLKVLKCLPKKFVNHI